MVTLEDHEAGSIPLWAKLTHSPRVGPRSVVRRLANTIIGALATVIAASLVIYVALSFAPGDPVAQILGARSTPAARASMRQQLGLNEPVLVRYWHWLLDAIHGDFGTSLLRHQSVGSLLAPRLGTTLLLVAFATVLMLIIGIGLGVVGGISARWRPVVNILAGLGISIPTFVASSLLISVFAVKLKWFPTFGAGSGFVDSAWHLTLPAISLALVSCAYVTQMTAAAVREEADKEHVITSRGRGVPPRLVVRRHILRNAALPVMTASGLTVAGLIAGSIVVEEAFGIDGVGSMLVSSISSKDYPVVVAISTLIVIAFVVITTLIDIAQVLLDPREKER